MGYVALGFVIGWVGYGLGRHLWACMKERAIEEQGTEASWNDKYGGA